MNALPLPPAPWEPVPTVPPSPSDGSPSATGGFRTAFTAVGYSPKTGEESNVIYFTGTSTTFSRFIAWLLVMAVILTRSLCSPSLRLIVPTENVFGK
jgi:hypothetical protein